MPRTDASSPASRVNLPASGERITSSSVEGRDQVVTVVEAGTVAGIPRSDPRRVVSLGAESLGDMADGAFALIEAPDDLLDAARTVVLDELSRVDTSQWSHALQRMESMTGLLQPLSSLRSDSSPANHDPVRVVLAVWANDEITVCGMAGMSASVARAGEIHPILRLVAGTPQRTGLRAETARFLPGDYLILGGSSLGGAPGMATIQQAMSQDIALQLRVAWLVTLASERAHETASALVVHRIQAGPMSRARSEKSPERKKPNRGVIATFVGFAILVILATAVVHLLTSLSGPHRIAAKPVAPAVKPSIHRAPPILSTVSAPHGLVARQTGAATVVFRWSPVANAERYMVDIKHMRIGTTGSSLTLVGRLAADRVYRWRVTSVSAHRGGRTSRPASVRTRVIAARAWSFNPTRGTTEVALLSVYNPNRTSTVVRVNPGNHSIASSTRVRVASGASTDVVLRSRTGDGASRTSLAAIVIGSQPIIVQRVLQTGQGESSSYGFPRSNT